jgi:predicted dehydrogenase
LDKVGIGLIGCGDIAQIHAQALERTGMAYIIAVLDSNLEKAQSVARQYDALAYTELEQLLNNPDVEGVFVLTRHDSHPAIIQRSLSAGKHVFSEKPLALTIEEALPLLGAVQSSERFLMVGFNHRWNPAVRWLHSWMQEASSPVRCVHITFATSPFLESWAGLDSEGGGVLPCLGSHALDLACYLLDDAPAQLSVFTSRQRLSDPYLPDTAGILLQTQQDAIASLVFHDHAAPAYPNYALPGNSYLVRAEVFSDGYTAIIENSHELRLFTQDVRTILLDDRGPLDTLGIYPEDEHFIRCIKDGRRPEPNERDGFRAVHLVAGAQIAAKTGCNFKLSMDV